jgi:hypothetical protein
LNKKTDDIEPIEIGNGRTKLEQFIHFKNIDDLKASADEGCHLCTLLWCLAEFERSKGRSNSNPSDITASHSKPVGNVVQIRTSVDGYPKNQYIAVNIELNREIGPPFETNGRCCFHLKFFPPEEVDKENSRDTKWENPSENCHDAQISVSTASEASFALARHWLNSCIHNHEACQKECNSSSIIPSRLIDVGSPPEYDLVRLCSRESFDEKPEYLTLSHCWGGAEILRLLESNKQLFSRSIPTEELPKTFRDAITITRRLGYRYLWIDSLCIIQDSKFDWESESAVMGKIYRGSTCTISALGAKNSHDGCFTTRNPLIYSPCIIAGDSKSGLLAEGRYLPQEWRGSGESDEIGRLHSRGWVVQERILSPRTLHYGSISISWECIEHDATEPQPEGDGYQMKWDSGWTFRTYRRPKEAFRKFNPPAALENGTRPQDQQFKDFFHAWTSVLTAYSQCSLTKGSDKLIAVNGLIRTVSERTGLTDFAGLWSEYMLPGLMWHTFGPDLMPPENRCPTWSWAAVDTPIVFTYKELTTTGRNESIPLNFGMPGVYHRMPMHVKYELTWMTKILGGEVESSSNGAVDFGYLIVNGPYKKVDLKEIYHDSKFAYQFNPQARHEDSRFIPDTRAGTPEYWALLLARGTGSSNIKDARVDVGLIVEPGKEDKDICRRYGYFEQCYWKGDDYIWFANEEDEMKTMTMF